MQVNLKILQKAQKGKYAVGAFNMTSLESGLAIVDAAIEEKSPVILQVSDKTVEYMGLETSFAIAKTLADKADVPVCIHFDHGRHLDVLRQSIKIGMSSIMFDMSHDKFDDIITTAADFVKFGHRYQATIELEEDKIGGKEDYITGGEGHTDPKRAKFFCDKTNCDAYAVSIGNAHGKPQPGEKLDLELLSRIRLMVDTPLVLHGASSTPENIIREAIDRGVTKINIDTDIRTTFNKSLHQVAGDAKLTDPRDKLKIVRQAIKDLVRAKMRLFGCSGKA